MFSDNCGNHRTLPLWYHQGDRMQYYTIIVMQLIAMAVGASMIYDDVMAHGTMGQAGAIGTVICLLNFALFLLILLLMRINKKDV